MVMRPSVVYTPCAMFSSGKTGNILTFIQFEEGGILTKIHNNAEIVDESDGNSIMPTLLSKEEIDSTDSVDESYHDLIST